MKMTDFLPSVLRQGKHRRVLFGVILVMTVATVAHAGGEREEKREAKRRGRGHTEFAGQLGYRGGFIGPIVTVAEAQTLADEVPVRLQGRIIRALKDDSYEFQDNTGTITVEIDRRTWADVLVNGQDAVEIAGEIEKNFSRRSVAVRQIQRVMPDTIPVQLDTVPAQADTVIEVQ